MPRVSDLQGATPNLRAFLDMLALSEGTQSVRGSDDGYNVIVGGAMFASYADHPRKRVYIPHWTVWSTAAGRYQLLARYFDYYRQLLRLPDFAPLSQDLIAIQQIRERKALGPIERGEFARAVELCRNIWASLPGAGYGQHENRLDLLAAAYQQAGGALSTNWENVA